MNILMTGCSRSVGAHIRTKLLEQGHKVYGVGLNGPDYELDLSFIHTVDAVSHDLFDFAEQKMRGPVEVLINNAAMTHIDFMEKHELQDFEKVVNVNMTSPFLLTKEFVNRVNKEGGDKIRRVISTSSMGTKTSLRASPGYCASKSGLEALTRMWAREFSNKLPIITCAIAPAGIEGTAMKQQCIDDLQRTRGWTAEQSEKYFAQSPLGRNCTFEEVWSQFDFAVNKMPVYCSGEVFYMTGGTGL